MPIERLWAYSCDFTERFHYSNRRKAVDGNAVKRVPRSLFDPIEKMRKVGLFLQRLVETLEKRKLYQREKGFGTRLVSIDVPFVLRILPLRLTIPPESSSVSLVVALRSRQLLFRFLGISAIFPSVFAHHARAHTGNVGDSHCSGPRSKFIFDRYHFNVTTL